MSIVLARLDNRLLHGIVASMWTPRSGATRVMVIDDVTANDPAKKDAMRMSKPVGTSLSIINRETAYGNFKIKKYDGQKVFVICNSPQIILDLIEQGETIGKLILGGSVTPGDEERADYIKANDRMYIKKTDVPVLQKIAASGTEIVAQYVPTDKAVPLKKLI